VIGVGLGIWLGIWLGIGLGIGLGIRLSGVGLWCPLYQRSTRLDSTRLDSTHLTLLRRYVVAEQPQGADGDPAAEQIPKDRRGVGSGGRGLGEEEPDVGNRS